MPTRSGSPPERTSSAIAVAASAALDATPMASILPSFRRSTGTPGRFPASGASRPPARAGSRAPTTNTLPQLAATLSAAVAASSIEAPAAPASAAAQAAKATTKEAEPVSTRRTGTGEVRAARWAALRVPDSSAPTCTETMATAPRADSRP